MQSETSIANKMYSVHMNVYEENYHYPAATTPLN